MLVAIALRALVVAERVVQSAFVPLHVAEVLQGERFLAGQRQLAGLRRLQKLHARGFRGTALAEHVTECQPGPAQADARVHLSQQADRRRQLASARRSRPRL